MIYFLKKKQKGKEDKILSEDPRLKQIMLETLHVRLSLVGSMFDFILVYFFKSAALEREEKEKLIKKKNFNII